MTAGSEPSDGVEPRSDAPPPGIRASDAERDAVVEALSEHATSGRLTLAELEERIGLAYTATTREQLDKLTADLPAADAATVASTPVKRRKTTRWIVAVMGGSTKRGRWRVAERTTAVAVMGGHDIDLRDAELESDDTTIIVVSIMGGSDIYVPDTVDVDVGGFALMGGNDEHGSHRPPRSGAPRIKILSYALMGGTDVWRLPEEAKGLPLNEARELARRAR